MKTWRNHLSASLKSKVAQSFIAQRNQEEEDFRYMTAIMANDPIMRKEDFAGYLFIRKCDKRPDVKWTDEVRMTKRQEQNCEQLMEEGATVWCGIELVNTGATAILMKLDLTWVVMYEDGTVNKGDMPMLRYQWPLKHAESKKAAKAKTTSIDTKLNALGGVTLKRY